MNIHEYQAKELFEKFGVPSPKGQVAGTAEEAESAANSIGGSGLVCLLYTSPSPRDA